MYVHVRQLRPRRIPGTMTRLMAFVDGADEVVSTAAREVLSEFSFDNYTSRFDVLEEEARRAMGTRVAKIDRSVVARLTSDLAHPARRIRLRAMEMAAAMEVLSQLAGALIERLEDEDHLVRVAAADALQHCTADEARNALLTALGDKSVAVQTAAKNSLQALGVDLPSKPSTPTVLAEASP